MEKVITPSAHQTTIYGEIANVDGGNLLIEAVAGSGKSHTLVEAVKHVGPGKSHIMLAFGKAIAAELRTKGVNGRTFHSLTMQPVLKARGARDPSLDKIRDLIDANLGEDDAIIYGAFISKLVSLARQAGIGAGLLDDVTANWVDLVETHDLTPAQDRGDIDTGIEYAQTILMLSSESAAVDFDDMLYLAVKDGITLPKFDFVFVDEAQDTNAIQRAILRKILKTGGRLIAVGDPAQAIYGFRGADSNSLNMIAEEFDCKRLPLSVSYRCATSVVKFARKWSSLIEAAPDAADGSVVNIGHNFRIEDFKPADLIVCRTTAPLVKMGFSLLRARIPAQLLGKDVGDGLKSLIRKMNGKGIDGLVQKLNVYTMREVEKALAKKQESRAEAIADKTETIMFLISALEENSRTVPALLDSIDSLFVDKANSVLLSTIHKSKGLEANRVYWLNSSQCPSKWARQEWQKQQEKNLCYVAATRAKTELLLIEAA